MGISTDLNSAKVASVSEFEKIIPAIEKEVDSLVSSANNLSGRTFKEVDSIFSVVESHLAADARLGMEEAKKIVLEIKAKL